METLGPILEAKGTAVYATRPADTVLAAVDKMCRLHIGALLVMDGEVALGILSERDLLTRVLLERRDPEAATVREVMTSEVACVELDTSPNESSTVTA